MQNNLQDKLSTEKATNFLRAFRGQGYMNIVAIDPTNGFINAITCDVTDNAVKKFIEQYNGNRNLHFMVNEPVRDALNKKLSKQDVTKIHGVYLDADPDKAKDFSTERKRLFSFADELAGGDNPPTYIIDSGGGIQVFWLLKDSVAATDENIELYEALSRGLEKQYNTDSVHNIDRIMRIPFTLNIPNKQKKNAGRTEAPALIYTDIGGRYD